MEFDDFRKDEKTIDAVVVNAGEKVLNYTPVNS